MKKLVQILTAAIVSVAFIGSAAGAVSCTTNAVIHNSGGNNTTVVECDNKQTATINCTDNVVVGNYNNQDGTTGGAVVNGNQSNGGSTSGAVVNYNGTNTTIGASCISTTTATVTPTPSVTPAASVTPGQGAVTPTVLPYTAGNSTAEIVAISLAAAAGIVAVSRLAIAAYRRFSVK